MDLATSEMKARKEMPLPEPARILANERVLQGAAEEDLIGCSNVVMCFVSLLNVTNMRAADHQVLTTGEVWHNGS